MMENVLVALITGGLTLIGVIMTNLSNGKRMESQLMQAQAVTDVKIQQLTDEVRKHNAFADRITKLEAKVEGIESAIAR